VSPIEDPIRRELIRRARDKKARQSAFSPSAPCDWRCHQVLKPESGLPFTEVEAWHFIADSLENGCPCHKIILDKPPGMTGYVIKLPGYPGCPEIYIKLTLTANKINGRSFHDSEF
jgi:hypothetical protein